MTDHWLGYSHSDQALLRDPALEATWTGLVVPGTLATFYYGGTGGFVLAQRDPYVIDPRTPLLQTIEVKRPAPRASHLKLLEIHDPEAADWWPSEEIPLAYWRDGRWANVVQSVLDFQGAYAEKAAEKISKYERLKAEARGESPRHGADRLPPLAFVPPYWAVRDTSDPWWALSLEAIEQATETVEGEVRPILALTESADIEGFARLIEDLPESIEHVFCWRGSWDETDATRDDVQGWVNAIEAGQEQGVRLTNLYGGYLSVLMTQLGLGGLSHGVGYSERRDVRRLGETGAPPVRYYVPAVHSFLTVPAAQPLIDHLPSDWSCTCDVCVEVHDRGRPVIAQLSPAERKRHFLLARSTELQAVAADGLGTSITSMRAVAGWLEANPLREAGTAKFRRLLSDWSDALQQQLT